MALFRRDLQHLPGVVLGANENMRIRWRLFGARYGGAKYDETHTVHLYVMHFGLIISLLSRQAGESGNTARTQNHLGGTERPIEARRKVISEEPTILQVEQHGGMPLHNPHMRVLLKLKSTE